jgi:hypothetical protein
MSYYKELRLLSIAKRCSTIHMQFCSQCWHSEQWILRKQQPQWRIWRRHYLHIVTTLKLKARLRDIADMVNGCKFSFPLRRRYYWSMALINKILSSHTTLEESCGIEGSKFGRHWVLVKWKVNETIDLSYVGCIRATTNLRPHK